MTKKMINCYLQKGGAGGSMTRKIKIQSYSATEISRLIHYIKSYSRNYPRCAIKWFTNPRRDRESSFFKKNLILWNLHLKLLLGFRKKHDIWAKSMTFIIKTIWNMTNFWVNFNCNAFWQKMKILDIYIITVGSEQ